MRGKLGTCNNPWVQFLGMFRIAIPRITCDARVQTLCKETPTDVCIINLYIPYFFSCLMQYLESIKIYRVVLYTFREKSCIIHFFLSLSPFFLRESRLHARRYE